MPINQLKQFVKTIIQERKYQNIIEERAKDIPLIQEMERIKASDKYKDPKSLIPYGDKIYSQADEDGIIREIFNRIGVTNKIFVEFGIGDGLENNTLALLFDNWQGLWIDASSRSVKNINKYFHNVIENGHLQIVESFITLDNINELISSHIEAKEIDLLSVDIDGNDYHILNAINCLSPRVIVVEYNAKFTPPVLYCMDYDENHAWEKDDCFGASLKFFEVNLQKKGYCLVGCNISGVNAFFVREDLVNDRFFEPFTAENHYEPARYYLSSYFSGHVSSYKTLSKSLSMSNAK